MEALTTRAAALALGVTPRHAQRLTKAGTLTRLAGNVVTAESVARAAQSRSGARKGRPWSERTAWAAIAVLSGREDLAREIGASQLSRLKARLRNETADRLVSLAQQRAQVWRLEGHPSVVDTLRGVTIASGAHGALGSLVAAKSDVVDGYFTADRAQNLRQEHLLRPALDRANIIMRVTDYSHVSDLAAQSDALAAFDLADSTDPRERTTGLAVLEERLDGLR